MHEEVLEKRVKESSWIENELEKLDEYFNLAKGYAESSRSANNDVHKGLNAVKAEKYFFEFFSNLRDFAVESFYDSREISGNEVQDLSERVKEYREEAKNFMKEYDFGLFETMSSYSNGSDLDLDRQSAYKFFRGIPESPKHYELILDRHLPGKPQDLKKKSE